MTGNRRKTKTLCAFLLLFAVLSTTFGSIAASAVGGYFNDSESLYRTSLDDVENILTSDTYEEYLSMYGNVPMGETIKLDLFGYVKEKTETDDSEESEGGNSFSTLEEEYNAITSGGAIKELDKLGDYTGNVLVCGDNSTVYWEVEFASDVRYAIYVEYYTGDFSEGDNLISKSSAAERYIMIDGTVPYKEARSVEFEKVWADAYAILGEDGRYIYKEDGSKESILSTDKEFIDFVLNQSNMSADSDRMFATDVNGNELKPAKQLVAKWVGKYVTDSTGYYSEPLTFHFSEGKHKIGFQSVREPLAIKSIELRPVEATRSYEEYLEMYSDKKDYDGSQSFKIQAEYPIYTSGDTIYALNDRSSAYSEPQDAALIRLNEIGGDKWQYIGQWIEWQVTVPQDGFYSIIPRAQQNFYSGIYVSRKIYINDELPFKEAGELKFNYSSDWQTKPLNNGTQENQQEFKFYLKEGVNTIKMEVVLGDIASVLNTVENALSSINECYRKILMITGPDADKYRDYGFDKLIPDVLKTLGDQSKALEKASETLTLRTGEKGEHSTTLDRVALICSDMSKYPSKIASQMTTLKDNTAALGTWLSNTQNQPLDIDYILVQAVNAPAPEAEPGFFDSTWYEMKKFYMSFFSDYNSLGATAASDDSASNINVEVWTATSRDQAQIIRTLVDDDFTPNYEGINVDIQLVAGGTLLPATLAGTGPDVYLGAAQGDPVNYAIRSAVLSLNTNTNNTDIGYNFTDLKNSVWNDSSKYAAFSRLIESGTVKNFGEVCEWFAPQSLVPLTLYGETYALPLTMSFSMLFYRKDIFVELGIEVPNTWEDFYDIIYSLQSNSLEIGFPQGTGGSMVLMYQQDEPLYDEGNYDYYLELMQRYYYEGDYNNISDDDLNNLNKQLYDQGLTYSDEEGNMIPKTDGITINLDSDISLATFKEVCQFFTMYDFPIVYEFANRFRSGEMPLAVQDYTAYNTLIVFAPEINGLWEFTPLPGTMNEMTHDINNVTIGGISAVMMMRSVSDKEDIAFGSWAFIQWYLGEKVQSAYGNEMVALLGPSAKQPTANIKALENMAWSTEELNNLKSQFNAVVCTPEYPGSYIIGRYTSFAFLDVVNNNAEPVEELQSQINDINVELTRKREEFDLPTADLIKDMEDYVDEKYPDWDNKYRRN